MQQVQRKSRRKRSHDPPPHSQPAGGTHLLDASILLSVTKKMTAMETISIASMIMNATVRRASCSYLSQRTRTDHAEAGIDPPTNQPHPSTYQCVSRFSHLTLEGSEQRSTFSLWRPRNLSTSGMNMRRLVWHSTARARVSGRAPTQDKRRRPQ